MAQSSMSLLSPPGSPVFGDQLALSKSTEATDESETEESEDDSEDEGDYKVKLRFQAIRDCLKNKTVDLTQASQFHDFLRDNQDIFARIADGDNSTLLHYLVEDARDKSFPRYEPLIKYLVQSHPELLAVKDKPERTALACAIEKKRNKLVRCICDNHPSIDQVLRIQYIHSRNCLHVAIHEPVSVSLLLDLINKSSEETLLAADNEGRTPLHLAVAYERCTDDWLDVVKALVQRCDQAIDAQMAAGDRLSPYRYHMHTRKKFLEKAAMERWTEHTPKPTQLGNGHERNSLREKSKVPSLPTSDSRVGVTIPKRPPAPMGRETPRRSNTFNDQQSSGKNPTMGLMSSSKSTNVPAVNGRTLPREPSIDKKSELAVPGKRSSGSKKKSTAHAATTQSADAVLDYLKLHCLRTRDHEQAVKFLYGRKPPKELYFNLYESSPLTIDKDWINSGLKYLEFEEVLQYVALPRLEVTGQAPVTRFTRRPRQPDGAGRRDMIFMFNFLRGKGVRRVLRVIVDDLISPAHSDEAIEEALGGFRVEIWDWQKIDICTEVMMSAAPDVREVHLYWSGNNAVLRGWSDHGGLAQLKKLEKVYLHGSQGLESGARTQQNVNQFKERLEALRPDIQVEVDDHPREDILASIETVSDTGEQFRHRHRWLMCMDEFADFVQNIDPPRPWKESVRVALIDDGVDIKERTIHGKVIGGRSFCHRDQKLNLQKSHYVSGSGHGTVMAGLICRVCPKAELFIVKLDEYYNESLTRQITAKSAAKAVRAAIDQNVDIISMSWTIERTQRNARDIEDLESAIGAAAAAGILMFCAANDQGIARDLSFPAACANTKNIFKVGAAEASGTMWKWVGDQSDVDFIFPGHNVIKERPNDAPLDKCKTLTGSSVATAIASGLAALVLHCVQLSAVQAEHLNKQQRNGTMEPPKDYFEGLKSHERMREALLAIGTSKSSDNKYIEVWNVFEKAVEKSRGKTQEQLMAIVSDVATRLKTRKVLE